jgi:glycerophosphoryl diester phosphodiesterase
MSGLIRVGHKGADALAPGNTLASFDAALEAGVDMIEFDVLPSRDGRELLVAHDYGAVERASPLTLATALAHMGTPAYAGIRLQLDIKRRGSEELVLAALDAAGARARAFISTGIWRTLARLRVLAPDLAIGWTVPEIPGALLLAPAVARVYRSVLPGRAAARIRDGAIDALVAHWGMVTAELVEAVRGAGGELYVWTVDAPAEIARLRALGVTGVITNDPRLFW